MTPEQQRIAIAKSVGIHLHDGDHAPSNYVFVTDLPDYLNDLNAMHEAEKVLNPLQQSRYAELLGDSATFERGEYPTFLFVTRTATQRAEAYLRTICKWEGGSDEPQG